MADEIPETAIPASVRKWSSWILGGASIVVGAFASGYGALALPQPDWLTVAVVVVPYVAGALGLSAGIHAPNKRTSAAVASKTDGMVEPVAFEEFAGEPDDMIEPDDHAEFTVEDAGMVQPDDADDEPVVEPRRAE